jgi:hypothetical protein
MKTGGRRLRGQLFSIACSGKKPGNAAVGQFELFPSVEGRIGPFSVSLKAPLEMKTEAGVL